MNTEQAAENKKIFINNAVEAVIRIGLLLLMAAWCFDITKPFLIMIVWGVIIAVASYPLYIKLCNYLHNRNVLASVIITSALLAIIFVPTIILSTTAIQSATDIAQQLKSGEVVIPEPPGNVQNWPLVGPQISDTWTLASDNLSEALAKIKPQLKSTGLWLLKMIKSAGASILIFLAAVVIAGFILVNANSGQRLAHQFAIRIMGEKGHQYAVLAECYSGNTGYRYSPVFTCRPGFLDHGRASCWPLGFFVFIAWCYPDWANACYSCSCHLCDVNS